MPPTAELRTMPPNTLSPTTCLRANQARSAVVATWFFRTSASSPRSLYRVAISSSSRERPNTSGAAWTCVSMRPAIGLTAGGGGGKTRTCANKSRGATIVARPAAPTSATPPLRNSRRGAWWPGWPSCAQPKWIAPGTRVRPQLSVNFHRGRFHLVIRQGRRVRIRRNWGQGTSDRGQHDRGVFGCRAVRVTQILRQVVPWPQRGGRFVADGFGGLDIAPMQRDSDFVAFSVQHALYALR